ncbi:hypothetical protein TIFTF001_028922 [Ficus carica]|uniref:Uncharacterized protein n=1 Tax=Ficus carica TaxID=3494 RepID=A0AA88DFE6_FICCA|nr:hypothetical protein TIFTF001_025265 [Ficus carica]GMN59835.1 hypothetical protein TIFTF001_028922 [Ficus carica]
MGGRSLGIVEGHQRGGLVGIRRSYVGRGAISSTLAISWLQGVVGEVAWGKAISVGGEGESQVWGGGWSLSRNLVGGGG